MISTATWEDILKESKNLISNSNSLKEREEETSIRTKRKTKYATIITG